MPARTRLLFESLGPGRAHVHLVTALRAPSRTVSSSVSAPCSLQNYHARPPLAEQGLPLFPAFQMAYLAIPGAPILHDSSLALMSENPPASLEKAHHACAFHADCLAQVFIDRTHHFGGTSLAFHQRASSNPHSKSAPNRKLARSRSSTETHPSFERSSSG
jgi:hypothetical protein